MTKATVIADSKNEFGQRIVTLIVTFPRYLLAEFNTHRMLSRNSASSRAIRFEKMVQSIQDTPFVPLRWQKDHPGMQGTEYFTDDEDLVVLEKPVNALSHLKEHWLIARDRSIQSVMAMAKHKVTKQILNRLLEPYMYHTCLVTATEWENFFALRAHEAAEINFQALAEMMLEAINTSEPVQLKPGEWHIPFGDKFTYEELEAYVKSVTNVSEGSQQYDDVIGYGVEMLKVKLATVRCARISYNTQDNDSTIAKDLELHDRLASSGHWSAFEHCARTMTDREYNTSMSSYSVGGMFYAQNGWCGNFRGFIQYRKTFSLIENRSDPRLIKK
jgi:thymidylate synthase ThyX